MKSTLGQGWDMSMDEAKTERSEGKSVILWRLLLNTDVYKALYTPKVPIQ